MKDKFEQDLFVMAEREKLVVPQTVYDKVDDTLAGLPKHRSIFRMNWKKSLVLAAAFALMFSITVSAAVGALKQRMEAMNEQEMEEYFVNIYTAKMGVDNYNRPYTDAEKARMKELTVSYEEEALFPDKILTMISEPQEYKGKGVAFFSDTGTFFFPDKEMSDEELLQIIDFIHKRDYSLMAINEKIAAGEMEFPTDAINAKEQEEIEATDDAILQSDAIWNPEQELTIPYTGDLEVHYMAAGQNCIFLTGWNAIHKMEIGSSDSTLFFDDFDTKTRVTALYQDKSGDIYLGLVQLVEDDDYDMIMESEYYDNRGIWILSSDGEVKKKIDLSQYMDSTVFAIIRKIVVDEQGYIYAKTFLEDGTFLMILDKEGNLVTTINSDIYYCHPAGGLGIGKDGKVYVQVAEITKTDDGGHDRNLGIATVNVEDSCLEDIYMDIVPDSIIQIDIIAQGADTDFVFWGYGGIYTYNLGEESAVNILPAYEAPCEWEGVMNCALPDGRIVFGDRSEFRHLEDGSVIPIPEKICFYYKSGMRNK